MAKTFLFKCVLLAFVSVSCKAQDTLTYKVKYIGFSFETTKNRSFINRSLIFINNKDTFILNQKLPYKSEKPKVNYSGIYYNCHLKEDVVYTIVLKSFCVRDIPKSFNNYYITNTIPDKNDCSMFKENERNTKYKYYGNYEKYVDIAGRLYEVIGLSPSDDCFFPH